MAVRGGRWGWLPLRSLREVVGECRDGKNQEEIMGEFTKKYTNGSGILKT